MAALSEIAPGTAAWLELVVDAGRRVDVCVVRGREPGPTAAVVAGVHGDEYEGIAAVGDLTTTLDPAGVRGIVILIPVANPTAFAAGTRTNPEDGANLARCFPGNAAGRPTERLASKLFELLAPTQTLIDLHSGGVEYRFLPVAGFYGPAGESNPSFAAARRFGLDACWQLPPTPGVLSYEFHRRGACVVGCEYLGAGQLAPAGRARYRDGVRRVLAFCGTLPAETPEPADGPALAGGWLLAEADGLFHPRFEIGQAVSAGAEVAVITAPRNAVVQGLVARAGGTVLAVRSKARIRAGDWGVLVAAPVEEPA